MKSKINCITLGVDDLNRSLAFYKDGLGLKMKEDGVSDDHLAFELDNGMYLVLFLRKEFDGFSRLLKQVTAPKGHSECILSYFAGSKSEVDEIITKAKKAGVKLAETQDLPWGYAGYFTDPDGHIWEIMYNPQMYKEH